MDLPELITAHRDGRSYTKLAHDCDDVVSDKRLQQLANGQFKEFQEPKTIVGLARGLRVSHTAVVLAVAESLGLEVNRPLPALLEILPASVADLSDRQVRAIAGLIYEFTEGAKEDRGQANGRTPAKKTASVTPIGVKKKASPPTPTVKTTRSEQSVAKTRKHKVEDTDLDGDGDDDTAPLESPSGDD